MTLKELKSALPVAVHEPVDKLFAAMVAEKEAGMAEAQARGEVDTAVHELQRVVSETRYTWLYMAVGDLASCKVREEKT